MCMSTPSIPEVKPPQEVKAPDAAVLADKVRRNRTTAGMGGGSLLTGPSGVTSAPTGKSTLLGQ